MDNGAVCSLGMAWERGSTGSAVFSERIRKGQDYFDFKLRPYTILS